MNWLHIYLISCLPALWWIIVTAWEDIKVYRGLTKPDHKFGMNWSWKLSKCHFNPYIVLMGLIPVVNLINWYLMIGVIWMAISDKLRS